MGLVTSRELREELKQDVDNLEHNVRYHRCKRNEECRARMSRSNGINVSVEKWVRPGPKCLWRVDG
jgi:hypothetical protein